jgi:hypothetical protein
MLLLLLLLHSQGNDNFFQIAPGSTCKDSSPQLPGTYFDIHL